MDKNVQNESDWIRVLPLFIRNRLSGRENLQRVILNTIWLSWGQLFRLILSFFVGIWVARYLGPTEWGMYSYAIAFVGLFSPLVLLGLDKIVVREIVRNARYKDALLGSSFLAKASGAVLAIMLSSVAIRILRPEDTAIQIMVTIMSIGLFFRAFGTIDFWFQSQVESKYSVLARNIGVASSSILKIALILLGVGVIAFATVFPFEMLVISVSLVIAYHFRGYQISKWKPQIQVCKKLLRESWPLFLAAVSVTIYMRVYLVILGQLADDFVVGIYAAANRLTEVWYFIPIAISTSVAPAIISSKDISQELYDERMMKLFRLMSFFAILISLIVTIFADQIVLMLFGEEYLEAGSVLAILIWGLIFIAWGTIQSTWDVNEGLVRLTLIRTLLAVGTTIILNILLIPRIGVIGAAYSTIISQWVAANLGNIIDRRTRKIFIMQIKSLLFFLPS